MTSPFKPREVRGKPRLRNHLRRYAVGYVLGLVDLLNRTLCRIDADPAHRPAAELIEVFLGDHYSAARIRQLPADLASD